MLKPLLAVLVYAAALTAAGQEKQASLEYLKKNDPDSLNVVVFVEDGCPGTQRSYERVVEGELLRARIKRQPTWSIYEVRLMTHMQCAAQKTGLVFLIAVDFFATYPVLDPAPDESDYYIVRYRDRSNSFFGAFTGYNDSNSVEAEGMLKTSLRDAVTDALTDYLKANFGE
ncbi:MAG: hypothetical protein F4X69_13840 [Gemmatimonadetes bacterium]|nr:hypothetical protein [Gemmatimonadota bacterium]